MVSNVNFFTNPNPISDIAMRCPEVLLIRGKLNQLTCLVLILNNSLTHPVKTPSFEPFQLIFKELFRFGLKRPTILEQFSLQERLMERSIWVLVSKTNMPQFLSGSGWLDY